MEHQNWFHFFNMQKLVLYFLVVLEFPQLLLATSCGPHASNLTCSCTNFSLECSGLQNDDFDIMTVISNISSSYPGTHFEYAVIDVENLTLDPNATFEDVGFKNLKLGSSLTSFDDDVFVRVNHTLVQLNLENNHFPNVPSNALHVLSRLEYLDMSHNRIVSLTKNDFLGLSSLKILDLQHNSITLMLLEPFIFLEKLEMLHLDSNNLGTVGVNTFENLHELQVLSMSSNFIQKFPSEFITKLPSIRKLIVNNNNISVLENINISSSALGELSASNCSISGVLSAESLSQLPNLLFADLSYNRLKEINQNALFQLQKLKYLNLSNNAIVTIKRNAFSSLHNLETLNLEGNGVSVFATDAFYNLTHLKHLNMNDNKLSGFLCDYTSDLISLETMELKNNQLKILNAGTFWYSPDLQALKMDGNNLDCTCLTSDFSSFLRNNTSLQKADVDAIRCGSPLAVQGIKLVDIDYDAMKCPHRPPCHSPYLDSLEEDEDDTTTSITATSHLTTENNTLSPMPTISNVTAVDNSNSTLVISTTESTSTNATEISTTEMFIVTTNDSAPATETSESTTVTTEWSTTATESSNLTTFGSTTATESSNLTTFGSTTATESSNLTTFGSTTATESSNLTTFGSATATESSNLTTFGSTTTTESSNLTTFGSIPTTESSNLTIFGSTTATELSTSTTEASTSETSVASTTVPVTTEYAISVKPTLKPEIKISNYSLENKTLCLEWTITRDVKEPISCSVSNKAKHVIKKADCPHSAKDLELYCLNDVSNTSKICLKVQATDTHKLIAITCIAVGKPETNTSTTSPSVVSMDSSNATSAVTTLYTDKGVIETTVSQRALNFTYVNIVRLNETSARVEWQMNRREPSFVCHLNLSFTSDKLIHRTKLFSCADNSFIALGLEQDITYEVCLTVYHLTYGMIPICHYISYPSHELGASRSGSSTAGQSTLPLAVLIGLLIVAVCIAVLLVARAIFRKQTAADIYNVSDEQRKAQKREYHRQSSQQSMRYSYIVSENLDDLGDS